jgi:hypothetical protein
LAWHLVATFSLEARDTVTPPVIFGIASDGYPSDTTGTMIQSDSRVTGKLRSYGDRDKVQRYAVTDKELKNVARYDENVVRYDDIMKTQPSYGNSSNSLSHRCCPSYGDKSESHEQTVDPSHGDKQWHGSRHIQGYTMSQCLSQE